MVIVLVVLLLVVAVYIYYRYSNNKRVGTADDYATSILNEINLARTHPLDYINIIKSSKMGTPMDKAEAIAYLQNTVSRTPLSIDPRLGMAAQKWVSIQGPTGGVGHETGTIKFTDRMGELMRSVRQVHENIAYGISSPRDIVTAWIIDSGVPDRGHRNNLYEPLINTIGVGYGSHQMYNNMVVAILARR